MITASRLSELRSQRDAAAAQQQRVQEDAARARAARIAAARQLGLVLASEHLTFDEIERVARILAAGDSPVGYQFAMRYGQGLNESIPRFDELQPVIDAALPAGLRSLPELEAFVAGVREVRAAVVEE